MNILRTILFLSAFDGVVIASNGTSRYRLPEEVIPHSYAIKLQPLIPQGYFKGEVYINVRVLLPVDSIYLHGSNLNIFEARIIGDVEKVNFELDKDYELIRIYHENGTKILVGEHQLYFKYEGTLLHDDQMGIIRGSYVYKDDTEVLMVTEFQPTHARRAFPCFDEPALKAIFNISIIAPDSSWIALSNTDEIEREEIPEGILFRFESTPLMSTELTSFVVTKMGYLENSYPHNDGKLKIRTFLSNSKEENQTYVLDFAFDCVKYLEEFTGINYPMSKIDLIQYDKKFTATEYWGLTTFKSGLLNPSLDTFDKHQIVVVLAHELTHYWFGNLVTNKWWNDIWLHEGFAQYLSLKLVDDVLNYTYVESYPMDYTQSVFRADSESKEIKPIVTNCSSPKDIMIQFNDITYIKAGSILRLLNYLAGEKGFEKIIQKYFRAYSYSTANTMNFISVVGSVLPNTPMLEFLETWLYQNRFPIISIEEDLENKVYVLRQQSSSSFKDTDNLSPFGYRWTIPIIYTTDIQREPTTIWFSKDVDFITIPKSKEGYIKLNYNFMGIYYTNYTAKMWQNLIDHVQSMNEIEQINLAFEAEKLFEADILNCDIVLKLIPRIETRRHQYGLSCLSILYNLMTNLKYDQSVMKILKKYYHSVYANSSLMKRRAVDNQRLIKRNRRSLHNRIIKFTETNTPVNYESHTKTSQHPRYAKCAEWIHENLISLINQSSN